MLPTNPLLNATAPAGPHLPVATLRQYAAGTLAPAAQHRVEAHTLACPRCADILDGLLQTTPATTEKALAQLQQRLRRRVQAAPAARPAWTLRQPRWLLPQLAAAAALLFGLVAGGWWAWQQRHAASQSGVAATTASGPAARPAPMAPPIAAAPPTPPLPRKAARALARHQPAARHRSSRTPVNQAPQGASATEVGSELPTAAAPTPVAAVAPVGKPAATPATPLTVASSLSGRAAEVAITPPDSGASAPPMQGLVKAPEPDAARMRVGPMPTVPTLAPTPIGGLSALRESLRRQAAEFVPEAPERRLSGTVQLRVTIGADGKIQQLNIIRGLRADYDAEAQRLVCEGPTWIPGIRGGRRAALTVDIAVPF